MLVRTWWPMMLVFAALACGEPAAPRPSGPSSGDADDRADQPSAATYVGAHHDITIDPATRHAEATIVATVRAGDEPLAALAWTIDRGLGEITATVDGKPATVTDVVGGPFRTLVVFPAQPVPAHAEAQVEVRYQGKLVCESPAPLQGNCDFDPDGMSRFGSGSVFPVFITGGPLARGTQTIVVRVPANNEVLMTSDRALRRVIAGDTAVVTGEVTRAWPLGAMVVIGNLASHRLVDGPIPVVFHHAVGDDGWNERLAEWVPRVMAFVTARMGRPVPCEELHLVKWAEHVTDSGQAMICLIALRELHEQTGDQLFEESWAHEIAHEWFGGEVLPADLARQKLLTEGLATRMMYAYRLAYPAGADTADIDDYWASRTRDIGHGMRYRLPAVRAAPVRVGSPEQAVTLDRNGFFETFGWEYLKTTAALDQLALEVGEEPFWAAVSGYIERCSFGDCTVDDFRATLELTSGRDLEAPFATWIDSAPEQAIAVGFAASEPAQVDVFLFADGVPPAAPLELWLELASGERRRERVALTGALTMLRFDVAGQVRAVRLNPRHDAMLDVFSAVAGDVDFDGVAGPADVAHCAALLGKKVEPRFPPGGGSSYLGIDAAFDRRCDLDADAEITPADVETLRGVIAPR